MKHLMANDNVERIVCFNRRWINNYSCLGIDDDDDKDVLPSQDQTGQNDETGAIKLQQVV